MDLTRLQASNVVMDALVKGSRLSREKGGWFVYWPQVSSGMTLGRRYQTRGSSHFPTWHRIWPGGGTSCEALYQLVRWNRGETVFPIDTWIYWAGTSVMLIPRAIVNVLYDNEWPLGVPCVLCGTTIGKGTGLDWWDLDGLEGPCCGYSAPKGCRQKRNA